MIEYLFLETSGYFRGMDQITFIKNDRKVVQKKFTPLVLKPQRYSAIFSEEENEKFFSEIDKIGITSWKKRYENYEILDGEQWVLRYRETGQKVKTIEGSNDYPAKWKDLIRIIKSAAPAPKEEVHGELFDLEEEMVC